MSQEQSPQFEDMPLRQSARRYRLAASARRFFAGLVSRITPPVIAVIALVVASRFTWPPLWHSVFALPAVVLGAAVWFALQPGSWRVPARRAQAAADYRSDSRGIYMSAEETCDDRWGRSVAGRDVRLRAGIPVVSILQALALCAATAGALMLPDMRPEGSSPGGASSVVSRTSAVVEEMKEQNLADREYLEEVEELVEKMQEESGGMDAQDWQALDSSRKELKRRAMESHRRLAEQKRKLNRMNRKLRKPGNLSARDARKLAEALDEFDSEELARQTRKMGKGKRLSAQQIKNLKQMARGGRTNFSAKQCKALKKAVRAARKCAGKKGRACKKCLARMGMRTKKLATPGKCVGGKGKGGVGRGPGSASLEHTGDTDPEMGRFKAKTFEGSGRKPDVPLGQAVAAPDENDVGSGEAAGGTGPARTYGGEDEGVTWHSRLRPRHQTAVKRFFSGSEQDK